MLRVYNTLSRIKEDFKPIGESVTMYSCGPTVYSYAHIGNMRAYIFMDLIRRVLRFNNYDIKGVMNITDVGHLLSDADEGEDKMEKAAREQQKSPYELAEIYTKAFFEDLDRLNVGRPEIIANATDHIQEMIEYVEDLVEKGFGYETEDGIYFDISKFANYGKLSRANLDEQLAGARVEVNTGKRHPADFAIWKKAEPNHIMQWPSPWGQGYPGWHIECSAMSIKYLGEHFDIHSGGVDHIPVHHENEVAQNEARTGKKSVNYWMHGEFIQVDGGKMSKSLGNVYTINNLIEKGYSALDYRYFCLNAHYRKKLNFTFVGLDSAKVSYGRLLQSLYEHKNSNTPTSQEVLDKYFAEFTSAINDDMNIPMALGVLYKFIKETKSKDIFAMAVEMDKVFGLDLDQARPIKVIEKTSEIPAKIIELADKRVEAKKNRDFALADNIRADISAQGYNLVDLAGGKYEIKHN